MKRSEPPPDPDLTTINLSEIRRHGWTTATLSRALAGTSEEKIDVDP